MFKLSTLFYRANFCAECGVEMEPRRNWRPRYFCDHCEKQRGRGAFFTRGILLIGVLAAALIFRGRDDRPDPVKTRPPVSAFDASPKQTGSRPAETETKVICGARTKKGTPCRHLVSPGQRCAQHRGKPSILE